MRIHPVIPRALLLAVALWLLVPAAVAQTMRVFSPDRVAVGRDAALHVNLESGRDFHGALVALPADWTLITAHMVTEAGRTVELDVRTIDALPGRYQLIPDEVLRSPGQIRIGVGVGRFETQTRWSIVPLKPSGIRGFSSRLVADESERQTRTLIVENVRPAEGNRALRMLPDIPGPILDGRRLTDIAATSGFTLEFWIRTAAADQVVLSSWNGEESSPYPIELVIDRDGALTFFQGQEGEHRSMRTGIPVADGAWHHIAILHDPDRHWSRLLVDGERLDSLYAPLAIAAPTPEVLALGRRVSDEGSRFDGELDELRIWGVARTEESVRATMKRRLQQPVAGATFLVFDDGIAPGLLTADSPEPRTTSSDLDFYRSLASVDISVAPSGVVLSWVSDELDVQEFQVERSDDGRDYVPVGSVTSSEGLAGAAGSASFRYQDPMPDGPVVFYRIRQIDSRGRDRLSPPVKVGLGEKNTPRLAVLDGNFPNPFNPTTRVRFTLAERQDVTVSVWDLRGQLVRVLLAGVRDAGPHDVSFTAEDLPSGTYFVRLASPEGIQSRQMVLMK